MQRVKVGRFVLKRIFVEMLRLNKFALLVQNQTLLEVRLDSLRNGLLKLGSIGASGSCSGVGRLWSVRIAVSLRRSSPSASRRRQVVNHAVLVDHICSRNNSKEGLR